MKKKMVIFASYAPSLVNFRGHLIRSLIELNWEVYAFAPDYNEEVLEKVKALGAIPGAVRMARAGMNPIHDLMTMVSMISCLRRTRPDAVLAYTVKPVVYGTTAAWLTGVPSRFALITGLGYAFSGARKSILSGMVYYLYKLGINRASKVFFQNPDDESLFRERRILRRAVPSVVVNGSGVDTNYFYRAPIPRGMPTFLLIGRLLGAKGVHEYVSACRRIRSKYPTVRCMLAGWIDHTPDAVSSSELRAWVDSGTVDYLGKLDDVRDAIVASSVFVLPSYREGTPRTVLEAMSMGRPVITTDVPGCRETVVHGENGFLVPARSVDALACAMERFVVDHDLCARMGMSSRDIALRKFDVKNVNADMTREIALSSGMRVS